MHIHAPFVGSLGGGERLPGEAGEGRAFRPKTKIAKYSRSRAKIFWYFGFGLTGEGGGFRPKTKIAKYFWSRAKIFWYLITYNIQWWV